MNEMNKLLALAFPAITAALALVSDGKWLEMKGPIYALFCFIASLLVVIFNNVWMQLLGFTQYKYDQVLPRLYQLTGRHGPNFGEFAIRRGLARPMAGSIVVQVLLLPIAVVALYEAVCGEEPTIFPLPGIHLAHPGIRYDCGSKIGYLRATVEYGLRHPELGASFKAYLENVWER